MLGAVATLGGGFSINPLSMSLTAPALPTAPRGHMPTSPVGFTCCFHKMGRSSAFRNTEKESHKRPAEFSGPLVFCSRCRCGTLDSTLALLPLFVSLLSFASLLGQQLQNAVLTDLSHQKHPHLFTLDQVCWSEGRGPNHCIST